jgi:methylated-DNA-protein-cysteine methyltransferase-like protein
MPYDPDRHGPHRIVGPGFHQRVYAVVRRVPKGRVTTFADVAGQLGLRRAARQVGYALAALPADRDDVPWFRVVTSAGQLSVRADGEPSSEQVRRLRAEGIRLTGRHRIEGFAELRYELGPEGAAGDELA